MPRILSVDPKNPDPAALAEAARVLRNHGLVAFPTETVYGLGALGLHGDDVARIFVAKGRPSAHPIILHVDGEAMARSLAAEWSDDASRFARAFWPGPLTLVVPRAPHVPAEASGGLATIGLRAPQHPIALGLIRAANEPLAAPSANAHTHVSPTSAAHVVRSLGERIDLLLDGGPCLHGIESTVLTLAGGGVPRVLRPGAISLAQLRSIDPRTVYEAIVIDGQDAERPAPGMGSKHYAPRAMVKVISTDRLHDAIVDLDGGTDRTRIGAIVRTAEANDIVVASGCDPILRLPDDPDGYAHDLFAALHSIDENGANAVVIEAVPDGDSAWWAVADRLARAAR